MVTLGITSGVFAGPPRYRLIDLHRARIADGSAAWGINDLNEIVGGFTPDGGGDLAGFVWLWRDNYTLDSALMLDLANQDIGGPSGHAVARDINIDGKIVGEAESQSDVFPHLWDLDSFNSHHFLTGVPEGTAVAINDTDPAIVVGWTGSFTSPNTAFRQTLGQSAEYLQPLTNFNTAQAYDVANSGRTAGVSHGLPQFCNACGVSGCNGPSWWEDDDPGANPLGIFGNDQVAIGHGINSSLDIVGTAFDGNKCISVAALWPSGNYGNPVALPDPVSPPPLDEVYRANAITNAFGSGDFHAVGGAEEEGMALLWTGSGTSWDVEVLDDLWCGDVGDFDLVEATDINNLGWIVGLGLLNPGPGQEAHAFLLVPLDYCPGDLNRPGSMVPDGVVDVFDMLVLLGEWATDNCIADLNQDGNVDIFDLLILLGNWGACPGVSTQVLSLEMTLDNVGLTMDDWDEFLDVMENGTTGEQSNYNCWMQNYLMQCQQCPPCVGEDPFKDE